MRKKHPQLKIIGKRIKELRVSKGFTQETFAHKSGLNYNYYGEIERGERNVAMLNLIIIATTLNVEIGDLVPPMNVLNKPFRTQTTTH